jgi:nucleoside-diphosphate-sugar epimerase
MKILITGGSGFIGSNLLDYYLSKHGYDLLSIDIKDPVKLTHEKFFRKCDILDLNKLKALFEEFQPDYVLHMAAKADLKGNDLSYYDANITGVRNIIHATSILKSVKKVVFASTMLVCRVGYIPTHDQDFAAPNLYGESKVIGEKIVREKSPDGLRWVIVRPSSIWGPGFGLTYRSFFEFIDKNKFFNFSGKMSIKTYGYIENVVFQIDQLMQTEKSNSKVYYLGDYDTYSIKEWSIEIGHVLGKKVKTIPSFLVYALALLGDLLGKFKISFPMTTFRYKNMTTDNILPFDNLKEVVPVLKVGRKEGNVKTIDWMKSKGFIK